MKIKLNSYKLLFRLLDLLSNSKWLHKLVINQKIYMGASIISLSMMSNSCSSDKVEPKETKDKKDSTIDNLNGNDIPKSKKESISRKKIKSKNADQKIVVTVDCYDGAIEPISDPISVDIIKDKPTEVKKDTTEEVMCYVVEITPSFIDGDEALHQYLVSNIIRPKGTEDIDGTVYIGFKINKNGNIKEVIIKRSLHPLLDAEAIRVVKNMPDWVWPDNYTPKSDVDYVLPVKFKIK